MKTDIELKALIKTFIFNEKSLRDTKYLDKRIENYVEMLKPHIRESKKQAVEVEEDTKVKLLASINSFLAEQGIKDTDGTPLTFSPERF
jgi:hypothetical protein